MRFAAIVGPLLLVACAHAPPPRVAGPPRTYAGKLLEVSTSTIKLDRDGAIAMIGFVANADALRDLGKVEVGDEVLVSFGSARTRRDARPGNELLSIRGCAPVDPECARVHAEQLADNAASARWLAEIQEEEARCERAMQATLAKDPRYVPPPTADAPSTARSRFNALVGKERRCATAVLDRHEDAVRDACELHHCGDRVAGGCPHIVGYSLNSAVVERAVAECGKP
jgi:hypothetical protein